MLKDASYAKRLWLILSGLLALRLLALFIAPWGLHGDEAQYWAWSREPSFGYFSKPPMIAWVIGATTSIFGHEEWAVRLTAPFLHIATTSLIFLTGRKLFTAKIGFWAALIYTLMPAVWLSSYIISTDAVLLLFWALALYSWASFRDGPSWRYAVLLGVALGLGLLSKYAMAFFIPVLVFAALFDAPTRKALLNLKGLTVLIIAALCLTPNLMWNAANDFATISHTAENANLQKDLFHPQELARFWFDQLGVFGLVTFPMLILAFIAVARKSLPSPALWLMGFSALPLLMISLEALLSRANANWAVTAYVAGPSLVALWAVTSKTRLNILKAGLIIQTTIVLLIAGLATSTQTVDQFGLNNAVKRLRAWPETTAIVKAKAAEKDYDFIAVDNRLLFYDFEHYGIGDTPLRMWSLNAAPKHHADLTRPLPEGQGTVLLVSYYENYSAYFQEDFASLTASGSVDIPLGPDKIRRLYFYEASGYSRTKRNDRT